MELVKVPVPVPSVVWLPAMVGLAVVPQHTPWAVTDEPPSAVTFPPEVAVDVVMADIAAVVIPAIPGVNRMSFPFAVPSLFTATILQW